MRKNIFQIIEENDDLGRKIERIVQLFQTEQLVVLQTNNGKESYTMKAVMDEGLFKMWKQRGYCVDVDDFWIHLTLMSFARMMTWNHLS